MGRFFLEVAELFAKGGPVMYLLLISSVAIAAIGIERFRTCVHIQKVI